MQLLLHLLIITISMFKSLLPPSKRYFPSSISRRAGKLLFHSTSSILSSTSSSSSSSSSYEPSKSSSISVIENKTLETLENDCQIKNGDSLLLSVSGGSDSMAMLHILQSIKAKFNPPLDLNVVHFNHKLRSESDEEAVFVQEWCKHYNLNFYLCENSDDKLQKSANFSNMTSNSIQLWSRKWRQEECERIVSSSSFSSSSRPKIVTAHHFDDQIETILMRLLRGAHISNLEGMKACTKIPNIKQNKESDKCRRGRSSCVYIKPFLNIKKKYLQEYLQSRSLSWYEDTSNIKNDYTRNQIRNKILPLLRSVSSIGGMTESDAALDRRFEHLSKQSQQVNALIKKELDSWLQQLQLKSQPTGVRIWATGDPHNDIDHDNSDDVDDDMMVHAIEIPVSYLESYVHLASEAIDTVASTFSLSELAINHVLHTCITAVCGSTISTTGLMTVKEKLGVSSSTKIDTNTTTTTVDITGGQVIRIGSVIRISKDSAPLPSSLCTTIVDMNNLKSAIIHPHYTSIKKDEDSGISNACVLDIHPLALKTLSTSYTSVPSNIDDYGLVLNLRHPAPGDRYLRRDGRRLRLVDHFRNEGVAVHERNEYLVLADEEGLIYSVAKQRLEGEEDKDGLGERMMIELKEGAPPASPVQRTKAIHLLRCFIMN